MKKIKYFETIRDKDNKDKFKFVEFEGYLQDFYDSETDKKLNVVFRKDDKLWWKATHLESGILITSGYSSKKACMEGMLAKVNAVAKVIDRGDVKKIIDELEQYQNGGVIKDVIT